MYACKATKIASAIQKNAIIIFTFIL